MQTSNLVLLAFGFATFLLNHAAPRVATWLSEASTESSPVDVGACR